MAIFPKATFFFKDNQGVGWSESYYGNGVTDLPSMQTAASSLAKLRCNLLATSVTMNYGRVSFDDVRGDSLLIDLPVAYASGGYNKDLSTVVDGPADFAWSTLLLRMQAGSLYRKNLYLSGASDASQNTTGSLMGSFSPAWIKAYNAYVFELTSGRWAIKCLSKDTTVAPDRVVGNFISLPQSATVYAAGHGFVANDRVHIYGVQGVGTGKSASPNGYWYVDAVPDANTFTIKGYNPANSFLVQRPGKVRKQVYTSVPITNVTPRKFADHKRGRPFGASRGRARNRPKA